MIKMLKSYLFWTHERGSFHYDVMVTAILLFLFAAPRFINFHDRPEQEPLLGRKLLVQAAGRNAFTFEVTADQVRDTADAARLRAELEKSIAPITGPVSIDHWQLLKDAAGKVTSYKVWARR